MTISKVKPPGWIDNWIVQPSEFDQLDSNAAAGIDGRAGQTDTVNSNLTFASGTTTVINGALTTTGATTIGNTTVSGGSTVSVPSTATINASGGGVVNIGAGGTLRTQAGSTVNVQGTTTVNVASNINLNSGAKILYSDPRTIIKARPAYDNFANFNASGGTSWIVSWSGSTRSGMTANATGAYMHYDLFDAPDGATLTNVEVVYQLTGGSRTPASSRLAFVLWYQTFYNTGVPSSVALGQVPVYSVFNTPISTSFTLSQPIDLQNNHYWIVATEEFGTNAVAGNTIRAFRCTYSVPAPPVA